MKNLFKKISVLFLIMGLIAFYFYTKPAPDYLTLKAEKTFQNSEEFIKVHQENLSKVIEIKAMVTEVEYGNKFVNITLDNFLLFSFDIAKIKRKLLIDEVVIVKGRYEGYNDLFEEHSFTDCVIKH